MTLTLFNPTTVNLTKFWSTWFFSGCTNIFLEHGSYGNQDCVDAINDLQKYLTSNVPLTIFEHLAEDRNSCTRNHNPLIIWSKDQRIKLGLFLHPSIRKFTVDNKGNELMLSQVRFQTIPNLWIHIFLPSRTSCILP